METLPFGTEIYSVYRSKEPKISLRSKVRDKDKQKWVSKLIGYDFDIKYRAGRENQVADTLSRKIQFLVITTVTTAELEDIKEEVQKDTKLVSNI